MNWQEFKFKFTKARRLFLANFRDKEKEHVKKYRLHEEIVSYLEQYKSDEEIKEVLDWLKQNTLSMFPYDFADKYDSMPIEVKRDKGFPYVLYNNKRMYLKKNMSDKYAKNYVRSILMEQDKKSPHRYNYEQSDIEGKTIADLGAAEGFFALDVIDYAKKVYLFECDEEWIEALKKTFADYSDKVEIVPRFIDEKVDEQSTTLDYFFDGKEIDMLKADIEGFETAALRGGEKTFREKLSCAILCIYHYQDDEVVITQQLDDYGFSYDINPGYILTALRWEEYKPPYLRRGVLCARRKKQGEIHA